MVDTGAEKSSVKQLPTGMTIGKRTCNVLGAEVRPFKAAVIESVVIKGNSRKCITDLIYLPNIDSNLLGCDLQVRLRVGIIPREGKMVVQMMKLTVEDLQEIKPDVGAEEGKYRYLDIAPIEVKMQERMPPIRVKQYSLLEEGRKGLVPIITNLLAASILEPCM